MQLRLEPAAVIDSFQKPMAQAYERTFDWAENRIVDDTTRPKLLEIRLRDARAEIEFTEPIGPIQAAATITVDGQALAWTESQDGFAVVSTTALPTGSHRLQIPTTLADPSGNALAEPLDQPITVNATNHFAYQAPDPETLSSSAAGNAYGFQARDKDPSTGWIYLRNRWYDPELGRFVTPDPLGYADGPNRLAYAGNSPVNRGDPLGLYQADFHYGMTYFLAVRAGLSRERAATIASGTLRPDQDHREPFTSWAAGLLGSNANLEQEREWHFPKARASGGEVAPGSVWAYDKVRRATGNGSLNAFAEGLHPLQDSWSHQGRPSSVALPGWGIDWMPIYAPGGTPWSVHEIGRFPVPRLRSRSHFAGHPQDRGGLLSAAADEPHNYPDDAVAAAEATYQAILDFAKANPSQGLVVRPPLPWAAIEPLVREFAETPSKEERLSWLLRHGVLVP